MFFLGLLVGVLVCVAGFCWWWAYMLGPARPTSLSARQQIWDIERRTIHELLQTGLGARRPGDGSLDPGVVDGTASEVESS
jgi:hypothetical protein